jgi:hypothetical protein
MYYEQERDVSSFVAGVLLGAVIGAGIALVMTPAREVARLSNKTDTDMDALDRAAIMRDLRRRRRRGGR